MSARVWLVLLALYAVAGVLVWIFLGVQVAPCLGLDGSRETCVAAWLANRGLIADLLATPIPGVALFLVLTGVTWLLTRRRTVD